jgi:hypothetical protein
MADTRAVDGGAVETSLAPWNVIDAPPQKFHQAIMLAKVAPVRPTDRKFPVF